MRYPRVPKSVWVKKHSNTCGPCLAPRVIQTLQHKVTLFWVPVRRHLKKFHSVFYTFLHMYNTDKGSLPHSPNAILSEAVCERHGSFSCIRSPWLMSQSPFDDVWCTFVLTNVSIKNIYDRIKQLLTTEPLATTLQLISTMHFENIYHLDSQWLNNQH